MLANSDYAYTAHYYTYCNAVVNYVPVDILYLSQSVLTLVLHIIVPVFISQKYDALMYT